MQRLSLALCLSLLLLGCGSPSTQEQRPIAHRQLLDSLPERDTVQGSDTTLIGKRLYFNFDNNISIVEYLSDQHLYWLSKDSVHGEKEGEDRYHAQHIEPHIFFVNWVEADGTTVSQVLDLKARSCQAFINSNVYSRDKRERRTVVLSGRITHIEEAKHLLLE